MMALLGAVACVRPQLTPPAVLVQQATTQAANKRTEPPVSTPAVAKPSEVTQSPAELRAVPLPAPTPDRVPWQDLQNGARVLWQPDRLVSTVAVQLWLTAGVASEPAGALGLAHLTERLLLHEQAAAVADKVRAVGGEVASFTTLDHTVFQLLLPKGQQALALDFATAILTAPTGLDEPMLIRQREQALLEQRQAQLSVRSTAVEKLRELSYPGQPYGRPLLGNREQLQALRLVDVQAYVQHRYRPEHLTVVASGALSESLTRPLLSLVSGLSAGSTPSEPSGQATVAAVRSPKNQVTVSLHDDPSGQAVVAAALPGVAACASEVAALDLWAQLLRSSRVVRSLGLRPSAEVSALSFVGQQPGLLLLSATVPPSQLEEATQKLLSELFRPSQREIEPSEFVRAKQRLLGETALLLDTPSGRARRAGFFASLGLLEERYGQAVRELTESTLRKTITRFLRRDALQLLWLLPRSRTPRDEAAQLERSRSRLLVQLQQAVPPGLSKVLASERSSDGVWRFQLPGGPLVLVVPDHNVKVVGAAASWPGGLLLEDEQTAGSHALLARLWKDAPRGRGGPWAEALSQLRGRVSTRLDLDGFTVVGEWPSLVESEALPLFLDGLSPPEPSEQDFERERRQLVSESRQLDEGLRPSLRLLKHQLFRSHPYQLEPTLLSLSGLSRKRVSELSRRAYLPSQMTLVIVGDVDPSAVLSFVESRLQSGARPLAAQPPSPPAIETPRQFLSYHGRDQALLALGFRVAGLGSTDRAALGLLYEVLLGPGGRLHRELVERRGLLLSLEGHLERGLLGGALLVGAVTTPASLDSAEASLRDELRRLIDHPLSDEELAAAQQRLLGREATHRQRRGDLAQALARRTALGLPSSDDEEKLLLTLTPTQVQDVARRYLDERQALLQAVLPQALLAVRRGDAPEAKVKPNLLAKLMPSGKGTASHHAAGTTKPKPVKKTASAKAVLKQGSRR